VATVGDFAVMDDHLRMLLRLDPDIFRDWSDEEVVRRWARLFPRRNDCPFLSAWRHRGGFSLPWSQVVCVARPLDYWRSPHDGKAV
jgi:hypothetical protein